MRKLKQYKYYVSMHIKTVGYKKPKYEDIKKEIIKGSEGLDIEIFHIKGRVGREVKDVL